MPPTGSNYQSLPPKKPPYLLTFLFVGFTVLVGYLIYQFTDLPDRLYNLSYTPSAPISALLKRIPLTEHGAVIFQASRPELSSREHFNQSCHSHHAEISILGCFTKNRIYLYQIDAAKHGLDGIIESVAAHELLHAAWQRLPAWEHHALSQQLDLVYHQHQTHLATALAGYPEDEFWDELHSRVGTEIADLPPALEQHYARYFKDQDAVVGFYQNYSQPFLQLSRQAEILLAQINHAHTQIEVATKAYYSGVEKLNQSIDQFNTCIHTSNCFATVSAAHSRRQALLNAQSSLQEDYTKLSQDIDQYNQLVDQYNQNVLRSQTLERAINSNAIPPSSQIK